MSFDFSVLLVQLHWRYLYIRFFLLPYFLLLDLAIRQTLQSLQNAQDQNVLGRLNVLNCLPTHLTPFRVYSAQHLLLL